MSPRPLTLLALVLLLTLAPLRAAPIEAKVYKRTNGIIEAIFRLRDQPLPFVNVRNNPFRDPGAKLPPETAPATPAAPTAETADTEEEEEEEEEVDDAEVLRLAAEGLKVTGVMHLGGQTRLTINRGNYAVGDILQVRYDRQVIDLRIKAITEKSVTFRLNEAEFVLNF
jgi:hypothetical protein